MASSEIRINHELSEPFEANDGLHTRTGRRKYTSHSFRNHALKFDRNFSLCLSFIFVAAVDHE